MKCSVSRFDTDLRRCFSSGVLRAFESKNSARMFNGASAVPCRWGRRRIASPKLSEARLPKNLWRGECSADFRVGGAVAAGTAFRMEKPGTLRTYSTGARPPSEFDRRKSFLFRQLGVHAQDTCEKVDSVTDFRLPIGALVQESFLPENCWKGLVLLTLPYFSTMEPFRDIKASKMEA